MLLVYTHIYVYIRQPFLSSGSANIKIEEVESAMFNQFRRNLYNDKRDKIRHHCGQTTLEITT